MSEWCPLCPDGTPHEDPRFSEEHVIPAELGGTFVVPSHVECNNQSAKAVDNKLLRWPDVEVLRALAGVRNTRTGRYRPGQHQVFLADGARALLKVTPDGITLEQVSRGELQEGDKAGEFAMSMPPTNVERHTEQMDAALRARFPGKEIEVHQEPRSGSVGAEQRWHLDPLIWPRFAAKVALCALAQTMPDAWRGSDGELFLLALFRQGHVYGAADGISAIPQELSSGDPLFDFMLPREHLVAVFDRDDAVVIKLVLFGELQYDLAVATDLRPSGPRVWLCDPVETRPQIFADHKELFVPLFERQLLFGDTTGLRHDRPHGEVLGPVARARVRETPLPGATGKGASPTEAA